MAKAKEGYVSRSELRDALNDIAAELGQPLRASAAINRRCFITGHTWYPAFGGDGKPGTQLRWTKEQAATIAAEYRAELEKDKAEKAEAERLAAERKHAAASAEVAQLRLEFQELTRDLEATQRRVDRLFAAHPEVAE